MQSKITFLLKGYKIQQKKDKDKKHKKCTLKKYSSKLQVEYCTNAIIWEYKHFLHITITITAGKHLLMLQQVTYFSLRIFK